MLLCYRYLACTHEDLIFDKDTNLFSPVPRNDKHHKTNLTVKLPQQLSRLRLYELIILFKMFELNTFSKILIMTY